tara:strand:- start:223 stop:483 length:261 start_codon:yes stop_codon:yes gene_type:complete
MATEMTIKQLMAAANAYEQQKAAGKLYREKYRKTAKGTAAHNRSSRRTYFKKKLSNLPTDNLTEKQTKKKIKWTAQLSAEYPDTPT